MADGKHPAGRASDLLRQAARDLEAMQGAVGRRESPPAATIAPLPAAPAEASVRADPGLEYERLARDLNRLARQVTSILEVQPLLDTLVKAFVSVTGAERSVLLLSGEGGRLDVHQAHDQDPATFAPQAFDLSRGPIIEAAQSGRSVFVEDVLTTGQYGSRESIVQLEIRSFNCVPLVHGGRVLGVVYTDSRQRGRVLPDRERALLEDFAAHAALALENARVRGEDRRQITQLQAENRTLRREIERTHGFANLLGDSPAMTKLFALIEKVSMTVANVLVQGETGTGKELIARAIHFGSPLRDGPWVTVNAGALPEALLESELFGHRRGSFTGAQEDRRGLFEEADGGTLFLDEVGEMSPALQVRMLRVLQEGEIRRVGDNATRRVQVRVIAATNRDLASEVRAGRFREDLYYRLNVLGIQVPPLRERGNDILLLAESFVQRFTERHAKRVAGLGPDAARWLLSQVWEGNVRQLEHCIERAVTLCEDGARIGPELLETPLGQRTVSARPAGRTLHATLDAVEKSEVERALADHAGHRSHAAQALGVSRQHLHNLLRKHGLGRLEPDGNDKSR